MLTITALCLIPSKRHDYVMPLHLATFVFSGLGFRYLLEHRTSVFTRLVMIPASVFLATPLLNIAAIILDKLPLTATLLMGTLFVAACGLAVIVLRCRSLPAACFTVVLAVIVIHGLSFHVDHPKGREDYTFWRQFVSLARQNAEGQPVHVYGGVPLLLAYELRQHQINCDAAELPTDQPQWIVMPKDARPNLERETNRPAQYIAQLKGFDYALFRLEPTPRVIPIEASSPIGSADVESSTLR